MSNDIISHCFCCALQNQLIVLRPQIFFVKMAQREESTISDCVHNIKNTNSEKNMLLTLER